MDKFFLGKDNEVDALTKLYRRDIILSYMDNLIEQHIPFSFLILDIDNFKLINDNYGHLVGDLVLKCVADSLKNIIGNKGVVGRYGGDEFIFLFPNIVEYDDIWKISFDILKSSGDLVIPQYEEIKITYTVGESRFPKDSETIDELIVLADKALYRGKVKGRNCFIIYLPEKHANIALQTIREKVYSPMFLHAKIFAMLNKNSDLKTNIQQAINFIGAYFLIDHLCVEAGDELLFEYNHPIAPKRKFRIYGSECIEQCVSSDGLFVENTILTSKIKESNPLVNAILRQDIWSCVLCKIRAFDKTYGYLRADVTAIDTGRIWQNEDLVVLECFANYLGMALYSLRQDLKKVN